MLMFPRDAVESLIGISSVSAVSEEAKKQSPDVPRGSEDGIINSVLNEISGTERGGSVGKKSGLVKKSIKTRLRRLNKLTRR